MIKILTIPFDNDLEGFDDELINRFMAGKTIIKIKTELFQQHGKTYWSAWIDYETQVSASETKYSDKNMTESQKNILLDLQRWRKEHANEQGIPVFIIATNKELEAIAKQKPGSLEALRSIPGFGRKKTEKYGQFILTIVSRFSGNLELEKNHDK